MGAAAGALCNDDRHMSQTCSEEPKNVIEKISETASEGSTEGGTQRIAELGSPESAVENYKSNRSQEDVRRSRLLKTVLNVDQDLLRGIPLKASLRQFGRLWRVSPSDLPAEGRASLRAASEQVGDSESKHII